MALSLCLWHIDRPNPLGVGIVVTCFVFSILSIVAAALRVWTRLVIRRFGVDDWFMCAGMVTGVAHNAITIWAASWGLGTVDAGITAADKARGELAVTAWAIAYPVASSLVKISICCALMRLALRKVHRLLIWAMIFFTVVMNLIYVITQSIAYAHDSTTINPMDWLSAINQYALFVVYIAVDAGCTILPVCLLWNLQMKTKDKMTTSILFGLGLLATAAACFRLAYTSYWGSLENRLWYQGRAIIWAVIEVNIGIIAGSMPALWKLTGWAGEYFSRRSHAAQSSDLHGHQRRDSNFGLVTIGQTMKMKGGRLGGVTRLRTPDVVDLSDEQEVAFGRRAAAVRGREKSVMRVDTFTMVSGEHGDTVLARHEVMITGGGKIKQPRRSQIL